MISIHFEPKLARTLTARGDSSPCADRGQNIVAMPKQVLCAATGQPNTEILEDLSATLTCYHEQPIVCGETSEVTSAAAGLTAKGNGDCFLSPECHGALTCGGGMPGQGFPAALVAHKAIGVQQNFAGEVYTADKAYTLNTNGNATGRNAPLVCTNMGDSISDDAHPKVSGTLCASGAGLSRPAGMASETDLCVVQRLCDSNAIPSDAIPIHDKATRYSGGGDTRNDDGAGNGLGVGRSGDPAPTITAGDRHSVAAPAGVEDGTVQAICPCISYCLQGNMLGRGHENGPCGSGVNVNTSFTLTATDTPAVAAIDCRNHKEIGDMSGTLQSKDKP